MASPAIPRPAVRSRPFGAYTLALGVALAGYWFFGRPFAYLRTPVLPLYVGEVVLAIGLYQASGHLRTLERTVRRSRALRVLCLLIAMGLLRLAIDAPVWGVDAVRDAALFYYALHAPMVAVAIRLDPGVVRRLTDGYERLLPAYFLWAPVSIVLYGTVNDRTPLVPLSETPLTQVKVADIAAFCAIGIAYLWLRPDPRPLLANHRMLWATAGFAALLVAATQTRGGLLAAAVVLALALCASPRRSRIFFRSAALFTVVCVLAVGLDVRVALGYRELSVPQIGENLLSLVESGVGDDRDGFDQNVQWRTGFWQDIVEDNLVGPSALTGQGFGLNLAQHYGLQTPADGQALRNAHNSHLSVLARLGVPGFALWLGFLAVLTAAVVSGLRRSRREGMPSPWLLAWAGSALVGILFNAVFDPNLEGPQIAVWTWVLVGLLSQAVKLPALAALAGHQSAASAPSTRTTPQPVRPRHRVRASP